MNRKDSKRKSRQECLSPGPNSTGNHVRVRRRTSRRRMTCPSPAEINKAMAGVTLTPLTKGCSLEELVEKCIQSFDPEGNLCRSDRVVNMILTMHSWVVPSAEFAKSLLKLYRDASSLNEWQRRLQICYFVRFWLTHYSETFKLDSELEEVMTSFRELVTEEGEEPHCKLINTSNTIATDGTWKLKCQSSPNCNKKRKVSLLFDHLEPTELANHLSYLEFKSFCKISHLDYKSYVMNSSVQENQGLQCSVTLCNSISQWVQVMILNRPTPQQRAEVFTKFIYVTQKLRQLQNFNTLMAVVGGLSHSAISRLKETHAHLSQEVTKTLNEMTELLSSSSNYGTYRRVYSECGGFKIPVLGVHLKDLVSLNEALPDFVENNKINFSKLQSLYHQILELQKLQQAKAPFQFSMDVVHLLTLSLDLFYTEDDIYQLSYAREAKSARTQPATPSKIPAVVVEWAAEEAPNPDHATISKHVLQVIDMVFKNYDQEQNGYICQDDFESLVASFPLFQGLERDRNEGPLSREEITAYFMKACSDCSKMCLSALHNFLETKSNCSTCLWSGTKEGYRCKSTEGEAFTLLQVDAGDQGDEKKHRFSWTRADSPQRNSICRRAVVHKGTQTEGLSLLPDRLPCCGQEEAERESSLRNSDYDDLCHRLTELEKERNGLVLENASLQCTNSQLAVENTRLQHQLDRVQETTTLKGRHQNCTQPTVTFILENMNSLHLQSDSEL